MRRLLMSSGLALLTLLSAGAQQPPPPAPPAIDPAPVEAAVREFYAAYARAWETADRAALADLLSREYLGMSYVPGKGMAQDDYTRALAAINVFFDAIRGQPTAWNRALLTIMVRKENEAVVAVRTGFVGAGTAQSELSLEVVRREADGRWRLLRRWSEKHL
ncbi:MAG: hypothetical protein HY653_04445 [Acidobacteria bacterium]|nr:hypothetical protein [Acidobacteriota bacterium]